MPNRLALALSQVNHNNKIAQMSNMEVGYFPIGIGKTIMFCYCKNARLLSTLFKLLIVALLLYFYALEYEFHSCC